MLPVDHVAWIIKAARSAKKCLEQDRVDEANAILKELINETKHSAREVVDETQSEHLAATEIYLCDIANQFKRRMTGRMNADELIAHLNGIIAVEEHDILPKLERYIEAKAYAKAHGTDIDTIGDAKDTRIEPMIKPLVAALLYFGFETRGSCQGHKERGRPYPWVDFTTNHRTPQLMQVVSDYNKQSKTAWAFEELFGRSPECVGVIRADKRPFSNEEHAEQSMRIANVVREQHFAVKQWIVNNNAVAFVPSEDIHHDDVKRLYELVKDAFGPSYEVQYHVADRNMNQYHLYATNGSLVDMQHDILHVSHYLLENMPQK